MWHRLSVTACLACVVVLGMLHLPGTSPPVWAEMPGVGGFRVLFEADSAYHHVVVVEDAVARYLRFDRSFQSGMYLQDPFDSPFLYAAYAHLGLIFRPQAGIVLVVGLGGGSIPKRFWRDYREMTVEVAELDPMVVDVANKFFGLPADLRLRVVVQDGRRFLRQSARRYDIIILDAYFAESIPFHLTTREFMQLARARLASGGIVLSNLIGALQGPRSRLFRAMYRTMGEVFPGLYLFPTAFRPYEDADVIRNIIVVASQERGLGRDEILRRARALATRVTYRDFVKYAADYYAAAIPVADVPVLTDDYAPVDSLVPLYRWSPPWP
ncbi:MAG: fused MFS/spermidine synthase [Armatimonadota bacterium]|nr:fused MFS/spermidine synthase [Armatimonadota bacterium]MDR7426968.1 fused MFS/spermidine synthase [Armatimonadota bacterium]MDR7463114.1 fused MFS/spermidine synthase [Armatimonadota bacterium]MDR7475531.1 fused MFS/spermidine synthase [Armatimonadota bacterium]MDR7539217.1 fused MFS/spermidine synthase [Armatimonadota bacterium]